MTSEPGFSFIGPPWLSTWGSGRCGAVRSGAENVVQVIRPRRGTERLALKFAV